MISLTKTKKVPNLDSQKKKEINNEKLSIIPKFHHFFKFGAVRNIIKRARDSRSGDVPNQEEDESPPQKKIPGA